MQWKAKGTNKQTNKYREDAAQQGKNHENKSLMGLFKSLGGGEVSPPGPASLVPRLLFAEGREKCDLGTRLTGTGSCHDDSITDFFLTSLTMPSWS